MRAAVLQLSSQRNESTRDREAALHGWSQAPYSTKRETDANFKRMVAYGSQPEHARAVRLGVASHNLFDVAYGLLLRHQHTGVTEQADATRPRAKPET